MGNRAGGPKQSFAGWMAYNRFWFDRDKYAITVGGGAMDNPGSYLALLPPINGATAVTGSPYFPGGPGSTYKGWDGTITFDWMPAEYITFRLEEGYRHLDSPYWTGPGGLTPPGGNNGAPGQFACITGAPSGSNDLTTATANCGGPGTVWFPDFRKHQNTTTFAIMVKF